MAEDARRRGRPGRFTEYEEFLKRIPREGSKRPHYLHGIGVYRGKRGDIAWIKISLPHGGIWGGKHHRPGSSLEIKLGNRASFSWDELIKRREELQGRADRGEPLEEAADLTMAEWAEIWMQQNEQRLFRSWSEIKVYVNTHIIPFFGQMPLKQISTADINRWVSKQLGTRKPATVKRQLDQLKAMLNNAVREGRIVSSPADQCEPIRGIQGRERYLSDEEAVLLLATCHDVDPEIWEIVLFAICSGMRKSEILAIRWDDVRRMPNRLIQIAVRTSKSDKSRDVFADNNMRTIIENRKSRLGDDAGEFVFTMSKTTLRRRWEKARKIAGLSDVTVHDLRRTHISWMAESVDLPTLQRRTGHSNANVFFDRYAQSRKENSRRFVDALNEVLGPLGRTNE